MAYMYVYIYIYIHMAFCPSSLNQPPAFKRPQSSQAWLEAGDVGLRSPSQGVEAGSMGPAKKFGRTDQHLE